MLYRLVSFLLLCVCVSCSFQSNLRAGKDQDAVNMNRERNLQSRLVHPNIVRLQNCFQDPKFVYLVLDYAAGGDVYRVSRQGGALPVGRLVRYDGAPPLSGPMFGKLSNIRHPGRFSSPRSIRHRHGQPDRLFFVCGEDTFEYNSKYTLAPPKACSKHILTRFVPMRWPRPQFA